MTSSPKLSVYLGSSSVTISLTSFTFIFFNFSKEPPTFFLINFLYETLLSAISFCSISFYNSLASVGCLSILARVRLKNSTYFFWHLDKRRSTIGVLNLIRWVCSFLYPCGPPWQCWPWSPYPSCDSCWWSNRTWYCCSWWPVSPAPWFSWASTWPPSNFSPSSLSAT